MWLGADNIMRLIFVPSSYHAKPRCLSLGVFRKEVVVGQSGYPLTLRSNRASEGAAAEEGRL